jgi:hypothetical protein
MPEFYAPPYRNPWSGEFLENQDQLCTCCRVAFRNTKAGDRHRVGRFPNRICVEPLSAGLVPFINKFGTIIWDLSEVQKWR